MVALHLDNSSAKADLCNQGGTVSPFLSRLACQILSLTNKHGIILIPAYIPTHHNVEANYLSQDQKLPKWHLLPQVAQADFHLWGPSRGGPAGIPSFHSMPALLHLGISTTYGGLGVECLQPSLDISGKLPVILLLVLVPLVLSKFLAETCKRSTEMIWFWWHRVGWKLFGFLLILNMLTDVPQAVSHHKRSHHGCFGRPGAQGSAHICIQPFGCSAMCAMQTGVLFLNLPGGSGGNLSIYLKCLAAVLEGMDRLVCFNRVHQTVPSLPIN